MKKFAQNLPNGMTEKCLSSGRELEDFLMADPGPNFAGIEFPDYMKYLGNVLDRNVSVIFRHQLVAQSEFNSHLNCSFCTLRLDSPPS